MKVQAKARHIHMSPRKVRLVVNAIRGLGVARAQAQLTVMNKAAAPVVLKVLNSAVANASHNHKMSVEGLTIAEAFVDGGPTIHRFRPRARGRSAPIRKRTSHITVVVEGEVARAKSKKVSKKKN